VDPIINFIPGLKKCSRNDWIAIDQGYKNRIIQRQQILAAYEEQCIACSVDAVLAVTELWQTIVLSHLPTRFPEVFIPNWKQNGTPLFYNSITGLSFPLLPPSDTATGCNALRMLGQSCEEDFFLMCPNGHGGYSLSAFVACFPNGFESAKKLGMSVADIHGPVPLYKEKLRDKVDKFFTALRPNNFVQRYNVSSLIHDWKTRQHTLGARFSVTICIL
jgi:hypothetical protein